jgi:hypothetical protein
MMNNKYNDDNNEFHGVLDTWFNSDEWANVCEHGENGDRDSLELMELVSDQLASLTFHLNNGSGDTRVSYEIEYFKQLCRDFNVI